MKLPIKAEFQMAAQGIEIVPQNGGARAELRFRQALFLAMAEVNKSRATYRASNQAGDVIGNRFETHPDVKVLDSWLEERGYPGERDVLYFLSAHVITEWETIPKRTVKQHRIFNEIVEKINELRSLIEETGSNYYRGGGHGLENARCCDLFLDSEADSITSAAQAWHEANPEKFGDDGEEIVLDVTGCFPTMEELLDRLAQASQRLADAGPIHSQPNKRGARTGYFVRRMSQLLTQRYEEVPDTVLAALATIALNEIVDADLAGKSAKLKERSARKNRNNVPDA